MKRRIYAWVMLAGFVLLLLNLMVFKIYWQISMVVYIILMFAFLLTNGKLVNTKEPEDMIHSDGSDDGSDDDSDDDSLNVDSDTLNVDKSKNDGSYDDSMNK